MIGGSSGGDLIPFDLRMPVGAKRHVAGQVYELQADGKLHFVEEPAGKVVFEDGDAS